MNNKNNILAKNTIMLYMRMLLIMVISFYTTRITLKALGVEDYGINSVIGTLVSIFSMLSGSLSGSVSRFFTFGLGKGDIKELNKTFSISINIHIILAIIIIIAIETVGVWFLNNRMEIPADRLYAANWVLQCSVIVFAIRLISVPYNAAIIAHEKMNVYAYMSIFDALARVAIVVAIIRYSGDRLILISILQIIPAIIFQVVYWRYCKKNFEECVYRITKDKKLYKEISSFAGWSFFGSMAAIGKNQGVDVIINLFCGPVVNTARGIATQLNNAISHFITNFTVALNPQIIKDYASGDLERMHKLIFNGGRMAYFIFMILSIPIIIEMKYGLELWLGEIPAHTIMFSRLVMILTLSDTISQTLITAQSATGKVKYYQIIVGCILLLNLPLSYVALYIGTPPEATMLIAIAISQVSLVARLLFLRKHINLHIRDFIKHVYINILIVTIISAILPVILHFIMPYGFIRFASVTAISALSSIATIYYIGCNKQEKEYIIAAIKKVKHRFIK